MHNTFLPTVTRSSTLGVSRFPCHCLQVIFPLYLLQLRLVKLHHPCTTVPFPVQWKLWWVSLCRTQQRKEFFVNEAQTQRSDCRDIWFYFHYVRKYFCLRDVKRKITQKSRIRHNEFIRTIFIVAPCILKSAQFTHQQMHYLLTWLKVSNLH